MKNSKSMIYLLIALVTLTVVVGVGMVFFFQKETPKVAAVPGATTGPIASDPLPGAPLPDQFDPVEWTRNPQTAPLQTPSTPTGTEGFTVTLPPSAAENPGSSLPPSPGASFPGDSPVAPAKAPVQEVKPAKPTLTKPVVAKPTAKPVKVSEYWVQVASFKDRYQAENSAKLLEAQGLKGILSTATVNGIAVVRVRVGPYTTEAEAGKFLGKLKDVQAFQGSYVTKASAYRVP